jgi:1-acyl-sn-glycerol-3-phosphate acyltransferase
MNRAYLSAYCVLRPLSALLYPQRQRGRENIPEGACIVCANHSNYIDPILVAFAFGRRRFIHFMAKKELFRIPILGWIMRRCEAVSIDRGKNDINGIRDSLKYLKRGEKLLIFPEGTRVSDNDSVAAKNGAIRLASKLGVPILPVYVPRKKRVFCRIDIRIGEPYRITAAAHEDFDKLSTELMDRIADLGRESAS